jgi:pSer/pThr/pTyr-binding forkhead associated (FHA) protein
LSYHHSQWWIQDLQSTNGTLLNDEKLKSATVIVSGDEIVCGQSVLIVSIEEH